MFRRLEHTLPADPVYEPDLEKLGFFINDADQVRSLKDPKQRYQYAVNRNDRWNEVYRGMRSYKLKTPLRGESRRTLASRVSWTQY
jgi:hypothetical protein